KAGAAASLAACDGGARQLWRVPTGPLYSALPGFCASSWVPAKVAAGPVRLRECRGGRATSWSVEPDGTLRSGGRCLALTFPAVAGAAVVVAKCDDRPAERWQVFGGPLAVEILSPQTGLCLAVPGDQVLAPSLALGYCTTTDPGATWRLS
ncbi:MAG TPA: ricin-type beta-trefoil lectin domain protein, partial [Streptosporangiaceae bacterium]